MPPDHGGLGSVPDQPLKCPEPQTREDILALSRVIRTVVGGPTCWSFSDSTMRSIGFGTFRAMLRTWWEKEWSYEKQAMIITMYRLR